MISFNHNPRDPHQCMHKHNAWDGLIDWIDELDTLLAWDFWLSSKSDRSRYMVPAKTQDFQRRQDSKTGNSVLSPAGHDAPMTTLKADEADEIEIAEITSHD